MVMPFKVDLLIVTDGGLQKQWLSICRHLFNQGCTGLFQNFLRSKLKFFFALSYG